MAKGYWINSLSVASLMLIISCTSDESNFFKGELVYNYSYESSIVNADSISQIRPHKAIFRYDHTTYQSKFVNKTKDTLSYYYLSEHNIAVAHNQKLDKWRCENYSVATDSVLNFKVLKTDEKILGYNCKILEFNSSYAANRYYVSTDLKLSRNLYKNHKAYNWQFYGNATEGGIILKLEHLFKDHTMTGEIESINFFDKKEQAIQMDKIKLKDKCGLN